MPSRLFRLKEFVKNNMPAGELPNVVFGRLMLKTGFLWALIREDTEISEEQFKKAISAVEEVLGKKVSL